MSVSLRYQGLPPDSGLVERVQSAKWRTSGVSEACFWLKHGAHVGGEVIKPAPGKQYPYPADDGEPVWNWCCEAVGRFPTLPQRNLDVHKSHQWLPFVLSAKVRHRSRWPKPPPIDPRSWDDPETDFDQLAELALDGAPQIAPDVTGTQGLPIRLMERGVVNDFGLCVGAMQQAEIGRRIAELVELDKFGPWDVARCTTIFSEFQRFFAQAAAGGEDVLVIWE
jgi:hypothetical protein